MSRLDRNLLIRVWGGDLAPYHSFSFDFVNDQDHYIRTPKDIKIYSDGFGEVLSIEENFRRHKKNSREFARSFQMGLRQETPDLDWETYIVPEGTRLRITRTGYEDRVLIIPTRNPHEVVLTLVPHRA